VLSPLAGVLRLASALLCLIVVASFVLFVVDQTGSASAHQQAELNHETTTTQQETQTNGRWKSGSSGSPRKTVDEAAEAVTSPFTFATEATSSEWLSRGIALALTLIVYGFGLAFVARVIRVRL
jgi:predicted PurR-regulated permease PerM